MGTLDIKTQIWHFIILSAALVNILTWHQNHSVSEVGRVNEKYFQLIVSLFWPVACLCLVYYLPFPTWTPLGFHIVWWCLWLQAVVDCKDSGKPNKFPLIVLRVLLLFGMKTNSHTSSFRIPDLTALSYCCFYGIIFYLLWDNILSIF